MTASQPGAVRPVPEHLRTVTPRLVVADGGAAIAFYTRAFGAEEVGERFTGPGGELIHAEIRIGDSVVMITEDDVDGPVSSPQRLSGMVTCVMALYWEDVDAAWQRTVAAGAEVLYPMRQRFPGQVRNARKTCTQPGHGRTVPVRQPPTHPIMRPPSAIDARLPVASGRRAARLCGCRRSA